MKTHIPGGWSAKPLKYLRPRLAQALAAKVQTTNDAQTGF